MHLTFISFISNGPMRENTEPRSTAFSGSGYTLGSEDIASSFVPDPNAPREGQRVEVTRRVSLWRNGFSVEDGLLHSYEDPRNVENMRVMLNGYVKIFIIMIFL